MKNEEKSERNRLAREADISVNIKMKGFTVNPLVVNIPGNPTVAELRDAVAVQHPDYANCRNKTSKEEFCQRFVMTWGDKVFDAQNARPTIGGKTLGMTAGASLMGYTKDEYEAVKPKQQTAPVAPVAPAPADEPVAEEEEEDEEEEK